MNKHREAVVLLLVFLLSLASTIMQQHLVSAQGSVLGVVILSPTNKTYDNKSLTLEVTFGYSPGMHYTLAYDLDGNNQDSIPFTIENSNELHVVYSASGYAQLPELTDGTHTITVTLEVEGFLRGENPRSYYDSISFTVDTLPPIISDISVENKTYYEETEIPLSFVVDETAPRIVYSLDGYDNATIAGNITLSGLSVGIHNITFCAWDIVGNAGLSPTVDFWVAKQTQSEQLSPLLMPAVAFLAASVTLVSVAALFWKKHRW
jgi:hypothetical protein